MGLFDEKEKNLKKDGTEKLEGKLSETTTGGQSAQKAKSKKRLVSVKAGSEEFFGENFSSLKSQLEDAIKGIDTKLSTAGAIGKDLKQAKAELLKEKNAAIKAFEEKFKTLNNVASLTKRQDALKEALKRLE